MSAPAPLALITGGTQRIGAAIGARLAADGWALALHYRTRAALDPVLEDALAAHQTAFTTLAADLADPAAVARLLHDVHAHFGRGPDLIVNNASLFADDTPATVNADSLARHYAINVSAPVLLTTQLAQMLEPGGCAAVINILDQRIAQPHGDQLSYTISKQALAQATLTLARALAPRVRVNGVAPGLTIATADYTPAQMDQLAQDMPLARLSMPEDIAEAVAYLATARAVTGQILFVDGGAAMRSFTRDFVHMARDAAP